MDAWVAIVMIVVVSSGFPVLKAWVERGGKNSNRGTERRLSEQDATIASLRARVEHLEALATDPTALAAMRVQQAALNSGATVPARIGQ